MLLALLACALPRFGTLDGHAVVAPLVVDDPALGRSQGLPTLLRVDLAPAARGPLGNVGARVHATYFPDAPPFAITVNFSTRRAGYADPASPWFNSFFGAYELAVPAAWGRPFGYRADGSIAEEDLARILEADWNWLSNWVYGVPTDRVEGKLALDAGWTARTLGTERIGGSDWDLVEVRGLRVVSAYVSGADGAWLHDNAPAWSATWRMAFGYPVRRETHPESFPTVSLRARLYLAAQPDGDDGWRTRVFGGAVRDDDAGAPLLDAQVAAARARIAARHPDAGRRAP